MSFDFAQDKQRGFVPILIVILIAILAGGYFVYSNSQTKTSTPTPQPSPSLSDVSPAPTGAAETASTEQSRSANWKTYTNTKYGFTIKYPTNLEADDEKAAPPSVLFQPPQNEPGAPGLPNLYVSVMSNPPNPNELVYNRFSKEDLDYLYNAQVGETVPTESAVKLQSPYSDYWYFKRLDDITVDNLIGNVFENSKVWGGGEGVKDRRVLVKKDGSIYLFGTYYRTTGELNNFQVFLSTFKLTQ